VEPPNPGSRSSFGSWARTGFHKVIQITEKHMQMLVSLQVKKNQCSKKGGLQELTDTLSYLRIVLCIAYFSGTKPDIFLFTETLHR